ncbi:MAG: lipopolysaccharide biosynthesis protein [Rhodothermales bacterium]
MTRLRTRVSRLYSRDGFRGPVVTLLSGTAVTLVLSYLAVPILTRLFTPEQFGISDYFVMMVSVLVTIASLRYEDAMMLPDDRARAASVFRLALLLAVATSALVAIATLWGRELAAALRVEAVAPWLWLLGPTLLLMRFTRLSEVWLSREKAFRTITLGDVANKVTMLSSRLGAGAATTLGAGGLIGGFAVGQLASGLYYLTALWRSDTSPLRTLPAPGKLRFVASRYRRFPTFALPSSLLNSIVARLPVLLLPVYFGFEAVGLFGRAFVALAVPLSLIGTAVSQVFFVHAAEAYREGRLAPLTDTVHARLVMLGIFPTIVLVLAGPQLFEFVFGGEWRIAGTYEQYLAPWFFLSGVASPLTRLFDVLEQQRTELLISLGTSVALTSALVIGGQAGDIVLTIGLIALAGGLVRLLQLFVLLRLADVGLRQALRPYLRYLSIGVPLAVPVWLIKEVWPPWAVALTAAVVGLLYVGIVIWKERLLERR